MQNNGDSPGSMDIIASVVSFLFSGLGGVVKYITVTQSDGSKMTISAVLSSFAVGAFSGMVVAFFLMSQNIEILMIISISGAFGYFGVPALWGLLRVFFRQIGGSADDLSQNYNQTIEQVEDESREEREEVAEYSEKSRRKKRR